MVGDAQQVFAVGRGGEPQVAIGGTGDVVVAGECPALGVVNVQHRVERRPEAAGVAVQVEHLSLLRGEPEEVDVTRLVDDPVDRAGQVALGRLGDGVVRLRLGDVRKIRHAECQSRRADSAGVLGVQDVVRVGRGRQLDLFRDDGTRVAEEAHFHFLARLAAGRVDGGRSREGADVQAVMCARIAAVGSLADHHDVGAVSRRQYRQAAVLLQKRRIVGSGQFESLAVDDGDERVEGLAGAHVGRKSEGLDLDTDPLALLRFNCEVVHVLARDGAVDGAIEGDRLRRRELVVWFLLGDDG